VAGLPTSFETEGELAGAAAAATGSGAATAGMGGGGFERETSEASARVSFFVASFWTSMRGGSSRRCMPPTARPAMTSSNLPSRSMIAISMCWPFMSWRTKAAMSSRFTSVA
jgi:hypothetical protein